MRIVNIFYCRLQEQNANDEERVVIAPRVKSIGDNVKSNRIFCAHQVNRHTFRSRSTDGIIDLKAIDMKLTQRARTLAHTQHFDKQKWKTNIN